MPFGGLLGSTFNFVFETQLENLQNADRFYYLSRTAGMQLRHRARATTRSPSWCMLNSDATHLPADIFQTPAFILEVDQTKQFNRRMDGLARRSAGTRRSDRRHHRSAATEVTPLVIRDNPATLGPDTNYLHYTGAETVVLGGTAGNDILIAGSSDDDTVYGDAGND